MDVNTPIENPKLLNAYNSYMKNATIENKKILLSELEKATFLSPASFDKGVNFSKGENILEEEAKMQLVKFENQDHNYFLPIFTDWQEINKWAESKQVKFIVTKLLDYLSFFERDTSVKGIVMNPFSQNLVIDNAFLLAIQDLKENTHVKVGEPKEYSKKMLEEIITFFQATPQITQAYFLLMLKANNQKSFLVVIDTEDEPTPVFESLSKIVTPFLNSDEVMDFVSLNTEFAKNAVKGFQPIYLKN